MRKIYVLMAAMSLLLLVSCQQDEKFESQSEGVTVAGLEQEYGITFKKETDPRDPSEFMSPEEAKIVLDAFKRVEGRRLKNPVIKVGMSRGDAIDMGNGIMQLQELRVPICYLDGTYLYVNIVMIYDMRGQFFTTKLSSRLGEGATAVLCYTAGPSTNVYVSGDVTTGFKRMLFDNDCKFDVKLTNTPEYNRATVSFPLQMSWDQRNGYEDTCEIILDTRYIKVQYSNQ